MINILYYIDFNNHAGIISDAVPAQWGSYT